MKKYKNAFYSVLTLVLVAVLGYFSIFRALGDKNLGFTLGLDLSGGTQLLYKADVSRLKAQDIEPSLQALKETIEKRVNVFGVSEPIVQIEKSSALDKNSKYRLLVELPGFTDTKKAAEALGKTPVLEFRPKIKEDADNSPENFGEALLTGAHLKRALAEYSQATVGVPEVQVVLNFNDEGKGIFAKYTKENVGKIFGIFLDGRLLSAPVIREPIPNGTAVITGNFTIEEAQALARNLNLGALPVPIELLSTQSIGASLGKDVLDKGIKAAAVGMMLVFLFMIIWYRLPGLIASLALLVYTVLMLAVFKYLPVTLTAAGLAGFVLSVGMAVDANVLIFERMKEELKNGKSIKEAIETGFKRAWPSIRDGNLSSLITAIILFWFGTSLLKGFALVFAIGILISMLSAIYISKTFLLAADELLKFKGARKLFMSLK